MAITNTRLRSIEPVRVFQAVSTEAITVIYICNTSDEDVVVNVFCIDSDDSSSGGDENMIYSKLNITAHDTYVIDTEKLILDANDEIEVQADAADVVTVTVSSITV